MTAVRLAVMIVVASAALAQTAGEAELLNRIRQLEARLAAVEAKLNASAIPSQPAQRASAEPSPGPPQISVNAYLDGYFSYNFSRPLGRINLLRAYDVTSNNFSLNQATLVLERPPDTGSGRRFGIRLDLMYGQGTETLQGGAQNEPRPQVFRPVFQAYGTYVFPLGNGLRIDFGKWASSLGFEGNYAKDQINYSRSYWFNFLPFYHFGFRSSYQVNDRLILTHWLVNGANQTEDFNGSKSQHLLLSWKPASSVTWSIGYYAGREQRDLEPLLNPGLPALPTQPGLSTALFRPVPRGRLHILDSYAAWDATPRLTLVGEADYVVNRVEAVSPPALVYGGAGYARYQFTPKFSLGMRFAWLRDRAGLFSGTDQLLKDTTLTTTYQVDTGFQLRAEIRRDWSNMPFFLTAEPGILKPDQATATLGLIWWIGSKEGGW